MREMNFFFRINTFFHKMSNETTWDNSDVVGEWFTFGIIAGVIAISLSLWCFAKWWFNDRNPDDVVKRMSIPSPHSRKSITISLQ
jgi:hypothetical protein